MRISVNGEARELAAATTVAELLALLGVRGRIAVEINGDLAPRSTHARHQLADGDRVEIVQAIGGGDHAHHRGAAGADDSSGTPT